MRKRIYLGVIEAGRGGFGVYFPNFPGCVSGGDTLEELAQMAADGLQLHIDGMVEAGEIIPEPAEPDLEAERRSVPGADLRSLIAVEVRVPTFPKTIDVPVDTELVQEIDKLASNRHQFIVDAARRELDRLRKSA
ncbi:MAG TPA: type II toxin-antitoxin system HicB family antitoxin [Allosphingosinicella sp.]|nr:type II toxin-antitoxin system HicB family antitoxin [Allosphingosinicella sp.]